MRDALESLAEEAREDVVAACAERVGAQDAEDLAHEGFLRMLEASSRFRVAEGHVVDEAGRPLRGGPRGEWTTRTRKERERKEREQAGPRAAEPAGLVLEPPGLAPDPEASVVDPAGARYLAWALPTDARRVVMMRVQGETLPEIATALGRGRWWVWQQLNTAKMVAAAYLRWIAAFLMTAWSWSRAHGRRLQRAVGERTPAGWAVGELTGIANVALATGVAATVVAVLTADGGAATAPSGRTVRSHGVTAQAVEPGLATPLGAPAPVSFSSDAPPTPLPTADNGVTGTIGTLSKRRTAATETPGDTQLTAATPSPDFTRSHTIIALGYGHTCQCTVLYRSTDAGTTWTARAAAPGAEQVVLPPGFPEDRRIFLGTAASSGIPPYVVDGFDGIPLPLPSPAGHIALAADFDAGDDRAFVSATGALWSLDLHAGAMRSVPLLTFPAAAGLAQVATATGFRGTAVFAAVPAALAGTVTGAAPPGLYACPVDGTSCELRDAAMRSLVTELASAPDALGGPGLVVALWDGRVHISHDGGGTFSAYTDTGADGFVSEVSISADQLWALVVRADNADRRIEVLSLSNGAWRDVTAAHPALAETEIGLVAITARVTLDLLGNGVLCTADGGTSWFARCALGG